MPTQFNDSRIRVIKAGLNVRPITLKQILFNDVGNVAEVRGPHFPAKAKRFMYAGDHGFQ